eukprot:1160300-Pelagomonas_calceolata.AAC.2
MFVWAPISTVQGKGREEKGYTAVPAYEGSLAEARKLKVSRGLLMQFQGVAMPPAYYVPPSTLPLSNRGGN